ncbi:protochlorophyllide-dependent translocon component 52, chloroplastic-like [Typha latifolia]|uniref:protochlorophyllide-dependent translocon component 52, chloroplastic-like n=1 Tax=Typha latifolia TaxID=4733 RepID=UPI003C2B5834
MAALLFLPSSHLVSTSSSLPFTIPLSPFPPHRRLLPQRTYLSSSSSPTRSHIVISRPSATASSSSSSSFTTTTDAAASPFDAADEGKFDWYSQWYPVALVADLDKRAPHAKTVMGLDLVVWWDRAAGKWQVFDDRCPHRLAPLSEGRVDPWGRLQCVYHGWCFDGNGSCKYIPQAPASGPPVHTNNKACVAVYPSIEQNKVVWFWPNADPQYKDIIEKKRPPFIPEMDDPSYTCTTGIREILYGYEVLVENLMDPAHVPYAHRGILGARRRVEPGRAEVDREGGGPINMKIEESSKSGFLSKQDLGYFKFVAPCLIYGAGSNDKPVKPQDEISAETHQKQRRFILIFMCIPVSPGRSRLIYAFQRNFAVWVDRFVPRWIYHVGQNLILDSDLYLLHIEERKIAKAGLSNWQKACYVPTKSDSMVIAFRNWLRKYSNYQVDWGTIDTEYLPPTPPKEQLMDRYWSHVAQCSSCSAALKGLKVLKVSLQVVSLSLIGVVAAAKHSFTSAITRTALISMAVLCFMTSQWLSHFIKKNFYFHDYNHAFK